MFSSHRLLEALARDRLERDRADCGRLLDRAIERVELGRVEEDMGAGNARPGAGEAGERVDVHEDHRARYSSG